VALHTVPLLYPPYPRYNLTTLHTTHTVHQVSGNSLAHVATELQRPLALMQSSGAATSPIVAGSWEYAVMCVFWDANYQRGLQVSGLQVQ
jgi:hypothetical protein